MDLKNSDTQEDLIHFRRVRPRVRFYSTLSSDEIITEIRRQLRSGVCNCNGQVTKNFATIYPPEEDQHYWSPQLTITIEEDEQGTLVRGLYGPRCCLDNVRFLLFNHWFCNNNRCYDRSII